MLILLFNAGICYLQYEFLIEKCTHGLHFIIMHNIIQTKYNILINTLRPRFNCDIIIDSYAGRKDERIQRKPN